VPASVSFTMRVVRVNSRAPMWSSSEATARVTAGGLMLSFRAASANEDNGAIFWNFIEIVGNGIKDDKFCARDMT
jgi:hypothetical protein